MSGMDLDLEKLTGEVKRVAVEAGRFLREERLSFDPSRVEQKAAHDYVSYVDKESERRIVARLRELLPEAGFVTEEGTAPPSGEGLCWVVDPLDGTTNYIHGHTPYCVSIALRSRDTLLLGVVYDPSLDECFYAWQGGGAYLNGMPVRVSEVDSMEKAFSVIELPYEAERYARTGFHMIGRMYGQVAGIRMNGSAALAMCYVAAGRYDTWQEAFIGKWDFSAAALLVMEAGGQVTDFYGKEDFLDGHHIVATNGRLHPFVLDLLKASLPEGM